MRDPELCCKARIPIIKRSPRVVKVQIGYVNLRWPNISAIFFGYIHVTGKITFVAQKNIFLALESKVSIFKDCGAGTATKT